MTRSRIGILAVLLAVATGVLYADDEVAPAPAGTWKVNLPSDDKSDPALALPLVLIKFDKNKDGKWQGSVLGALPKLESLTKAKVEKIRVDDKTWKFTIKSEGQSLNFEVLLGKDAKAKTFYGELRPRGQAIPVELERTKMTAVDEFELYRENIVNEPPGMRAVRYARFLLAGAEENKIKPAEARAWAEKAVKSAALYGPGVLRDEQLLVARILSEQTGFEATALQYAKRAEAGLDEKAEGPVATKRVLDVLAAVQEKAGKKDDAAQTQLRIKKLNFAVKTIKYPGRKAKSDRVVLVELFTTAQAKGAVAAEVAAQALQKTFKPGEVLVLLYHQHFPSGNPLGSPESEERLGYYRVRALPTLIFNGEQGVQAGGGPEDAQEQYDKFAESIEPLLETAAKAELKLTATRKDGKINVSAEVSKLEDPDEMMRLRVALVETETAYKGGSGTATHYNVVRTMLGGDEGTALTKKSQKKTFSVDEKDLRKKLEEYQEKVNKKRPFPNKEKPLDLKSFRVVAFVQNDSTKEVLQAASVDLKE